MCCRSCFAKLFEADEPVPWKAMEQRTPSDPIQVADSGCKLADVSRLTNCTEGPLPEVLQIPCLHQHTRVALLSHTSACCMMMALDRDNLLIHA